jgi:hypothetical protein
MNGIHIDRLAIQIPGLSNEEGRQLGLRMAAALAAAGGIPAAGDIPALHLDVEADMSAGLPRLADRIVIELLRQLRREP